MELPTLQWATSTHRRKGHGERAEVSSSERKLFKFCFPDLFLSNGSLKPSVVTD